MKDITTFIEYDAKYIVVDNGRLFVDINMPERGKNITLKDQDGEMYSMTNITEEVPSSEEIQASCMRAFDKASPEDKQRMIDELRKEIKEDDERRKSRT